MTRDQLEAWTLQICQEAIAVNATAANEVIRALTGGYEVFAPQGHASERLHRAAAAFLAIARL